MTEWAPRPLTVEVDLAHGGRWTSLRTPEREWLWRNPDPAVARARAAVPPGAAFVDAGGVEERLPTVRGEPDHGAVWSRPWSVAGVTADGFHLQRRIAVDESLTVDYTITGPPNAPFIHAVHALLDVSPDARLEAPGVRTAYLVDQDSTVAWPAGLDRFGPDDGTAIAAVLPGCAAVTVVDGLDALAFTWAGDPASLLLWRNLRGWPEASPYRSIGIEPMVGTTASLAEPAPGGPARLGPDGCSGGSSRSRRGAPRLQESHIPVLQVHECGFPELRRHQLSGEPKISRSLRRVFLIDPALPFGKPSSSIPLATGEPR